MAMSPNERKPPVHQLVEGIRTTSGQDGGTVLDIGGNRIFRVNAIGDLILRCLQQGWNEVKIATHISSQYSVTEELAKRDIHEFLKVLHEHRLIHSFRRPEES